MRTANTDREGRRKTEEWTKLLSKVGHVDLWLEYRFIRPCSVESYWSEHCMINNTKLQATQGTKPCRFTGIDQKTWSLLHSDTTSMGADILTGSGTGGGKDTHCTCAVVMCSSPVVQNWYDLAPCGHHFHYLTSINYSLILPKRTILVPNME